MKAKLVLAAVLSLPLWASPVPASRRLRELPLRFEPNRGQDPGGDAYLARAGDFVLSIGPRGSRLRTPSGGGVTLRLDRARTAVLAPEQPLPGRTNYLLGRDSSRWITGLPGYSRVRSKQVYPGIDLIYYGKNGQIEYDFEVSPGANAQQIGMRFEGAPAVRLDASGDLLILTQFGTLRQKRPVAYQRLGGGERRLVEAAFRIDGTGMVGFTLGRYDRTRPLIIDPVMVFATYLGSSGDEDSFGALAVDASGNTYIAGQSVKLSGQPADYPVTTGAYQRTSRSGFDAVITKLSADGTQLLYSTYLGGQGEDSVTSIAVHSDGSLYFCGDTGSTDFPVTTGVLQTAYGGSDSDAFFGRLSPDGSSLVFASYWGGTAADGCKGIALNLPNRIFLGINTASAGLRVSNDAFQPQKSSLDDLYFVSVSPDGTAFVGGTYLGGTGTDEINQMVPDAQGNLLVAGQTDSPDFPTTTGSQFLSGPSDGFVLKLGPTFNRTFVRLIGGHGTDAALGITSDLGNNIYVTGVTDSTNFPTTAGVYQTAPGGGTDGFLTKLGSGGAILFTTLIGGSGDDSAWAASVDVVGNVTVAGETVSVNFPLTDDALQRVTVKEFEDGDSDAFILRLNPDGSLLQYATLLGGNYPEHMTAMRVDAAGIATIIGTTASDDFPVTAGAFQTTLGVCRTDLDSSCQRFFIARLDMAHEPAAGPRVLTNGVVNSADYSRGGVAPGDVVTIYGFGLGPADLVGTQLTTDGTIKLELAGTKVFFNGMQAAMIYTSANQISAVVPYRIAGAKTASVQVEYNNVRSAPVIVPVRFAKLALYTADSSGAGPAAARNVDYSVNSAANPVAKGSAILLWATGLGIVSPPQIEGAINTAPLPQPTSPVSATIGGKTARVLYAGGAPGLSVGVAQINLEIPAGIPSGKVPVVVTIGEGPSSYSSQDGVTIAVQ